MPVIKRNSLHVNLLKLFLIWFTSFGIFNLILIPRSIDYTSNSVITVSLFIISTILTLQQFPAIRQEIKKRSRLVHLLVLLLTVLLDIFLWHLIDSRTKLPPLTRASLLKYPVFNLEIKYFLTKLFDLLFQQVFVFTTLILLSGQGHNKRRIIPIFSIYFGLLHLPILLVANDLWGFYCLLLSITGAGLFAFLALSFELGLLINYILHLQFYVFSPILIRLFT